jgi:hypothetical protein
VRSEDDVSVGRYDPLPNDAALTVIRIGVVISPMVAISPMTVAPAVFVPGTDAGVERSDFDANAAGVGPHINLREGWYSRNQGTGRRGGKE